MHYIMNKDTPIIEIETCKIITNKMELIPYSLRLCKKFKFKCYTRVDKGKGTSIK